MTALSGMTWRHPRGIDGLVAADDPDEPVTWISRSLLDFGDQPVHQFFAEHDLLVIDHPHIADAVAAGALVALDDLVPPSSMGAAAADGLGQSHSSYRYLGRQWAFAVDAAAQVTAYRPDLLDTPPTTWEEALTLGQEHRLLWPYAAVDAFSTFATVLAQRGHPLDRPGDLADDDALDALDLLIRLADAVPDRCATMNPIDAAEALAGGDEYLACVALYGYTNYSRAGFRRHLVRYRDIPSFSGVPRGAMLGGAGIAVSAASTRPEAAARVAARLASADVQSTTYTTGGGQPASRAAWTDPTLDRFTDAFFAGTLATLESAWCRPRVVGWPAYQLAASHVVRDAVIRRRAPESFGASLRTLAEEHIGGNASEGAA